jgi:hypothetical protein
VSLVASCRLILCVVIAAISARAPAAEPAVSQDIIRFVGSWDVIYETPSSCKAKTITFSLSGADRANAPVRLRGEERMTCGGAQGLLHYDVVFRTYTRASDNQTRLGLSLYPPSPAQGEKKAFERLSERFEYTPDQLTLWLERDCELAGSREDEKGVAGYVRLKKSGCVGAAHDKSRNVKR